MVILVIGWILSLNATDETERPPSVAEPEPTMGQQSRQPAANSSGELEEASEPINAAVGPESAAEPLRWDGRTGTEISLPEDSPELVLAVGQIAELNATLFDYGTSDNPTVADVIGTKPRFYVEGIEPGTTILRFYFGPTLFRDIVAVVADPVAEPTLEAIASDDQAGLDQCFQDGESSDGQLRARVLIGRTGQVVEAHAEMSTVGADVRECLLHRLRMWQFPAAETMLTGSWRMSWQDGAVCQPGEDC